MCSPLKTHKDLVILFPWLGFPSSTMYFMSKIGWSFWENGQIMTNDEHAAISTLKPHSSMNEPTIPCS